MFSKSARWALAWMFLATACGDDEPKKGDEGCQPERATSCEAGLVCEQVGAERHACLPPVIVAGRVFGAVDGLGIVGASIVGLDVNGAARTRVARSTVDGRYELPVSVRRNDDGSPVEDAITLRVAAADHQPFPAAPRTALPIELARAVQRSDADAGAGANVAFHIENTATSVALIPVPEAERGGVTIEGTVAADAPGGALVLAVSGERAIASAISDADGAFVLFNVKSGSVRVEGYRAGLALTPQIVEVAGAPVTNLALASSGAPLSNVSGSVNVVNAAGGLTTSVILVVASTFDAALARGEAPAGLRAANVGGAFRIENVPPGRYAVLAAFENDLLVRDPDEGIAGTAIVFQDVGNAGGEVVVSQSFKVTGALEVVSPGAMGVEEVAAGALNLEWRDDSSEDGFELRVYDALGNMVHENLQIPRQTGHPTVQYPLDGAGLQRGMLYQFRVWSWRARQEGRSYIAASEDLKGVFQIAR